jgi:hypothetical protein
MPTYAVDPLHTEMLRCQRCGKDLFPIDPEDTPAMWPLTAQQVAEVYPYGAEAIWNHEAVCGRED